jgi:hypothetical protein
MGGFTEAASRHVIIDDLSKSVGEVALGIDTIGGDRVGGLLGLFL